MPPIESNKTEIVRVQQGKVIGVRFSSDLKWQDNMDYVCAKGPQRLYFLRMPKRAGV